MQKEEYFQGIINAIDPVNAEYISRDQDTMRCFEMLEMYMQKGRLDMAAFTFREAKAQIADFKKRWLTPANIKPGDGVTICLWTDRYAATVTKVTKTTVTVRRDKAILDPDFKPERIPGGFAGHCINNYDQRYFYKPDPYGDVYRFSWSRKYQTYGQPNSLRLIKGRHEFYDFNF